MSSDIDAIARAHLRQSDARLARWMDRIGDIPVPRPERFSLVQALARSIIYQQLNGKAAQTIFGRMQQAVGGSVTARALKQADDEQLRAAGVSGAKARALKDLAEHALARRLPSAAALQQMPDEEAIERLTIVRGIGPWTVQMLLMFRLGRGDILPLSDYGVGEGARVGKELGDMASHAQLGQGGGEIGAGWLGASRD